MNLATLLHRAAALHGERACLTLGAEVVYTYADASRAVSRIAAGMRDRLHLDPGARIAVFMPNTPEYLVIPASGQFDAEEILSLIGHWPRCTFFFAPTMVRRLVEAIASRNDAARNIKTIVYGGGPMYVEDLLHAMRAIGPKLTQIYGQGEAPMGRGGRRVHRLPSRP